MGKSLFVFPGQGSQAVGMCKDIFEKDPTAADLFRKASEYCEFDLPKLIFEGTEEELKKTENAQPAILVCSYALCSVLRDRGRIPSLVAGHSLGEYTALQSHREAGARPRKTDGQGGKAASRGNGRHYRACRPGG